MKKRIMFAALMISGLLLTFSQPLVAQSAADLSTLKVKLTYKGKGEVDSTHGIHAYLFDSPDFASGAMVMPINMNSVWKNGDVLTFPSLSADAVYLTVAYGDYDVMMGPPPTGTPVAMYEVGQPTPTPIKLDRETVEIEVVFDDTFSMP
jgi:hypothetical protein